MAAANGESFAIEQLCIGKIIDVNRDEVFAPFEVTFFKGLFRYGDKLTALVGRARGFGKPCDLGWLQDILLTTHRSLDVRKKRLIRGDGNPLPILSRAFNITESVFFAELRRAGFLDQPFEQLFLHIMGVFHKKLNLMDALSHYPCQYRINQSHSRSLNH